MSGDRRRVGMCDLRRNRNGGMKQAACDEKHEQCPRAGSDSYVHWRRSQNSEANTLNYYYKVNAFKCFYNMVIFCFINDSVFIVNYRCS